MNNNNTLLLVSQLMVKEATLIVDHESLYDVEFQI